MGYMIEISESKVEHLAEKVGKALRYMGEAMTCIDEMENGSEMGERGGMRDYREMGMRGGYRYGNRNPDYEEMGERRGVPGSGRGYYR